MNTHNVAKLPDNAARTTRRSVLVGAACLPALAVPALAAAELDPIFAAFASAPIADDPLLTLLRRYESALAAYDSIQPEDEIYEEDMDAAIGRTMREFNDRQPPATSTVGALAALDHVLQDHDLFEERDKYAGLQMLWLLIKAARDHIAAAAARGDYAANLRMIPLYKASGDEVQS